MLSPEKRETIKEILQRIAQGKSVSLEERKYLKKQADRDQTVAAWLHSARRQLIKQNNLSDPIENLLDNLSVGSLDPDSSHHSEEDLGDFFLGAPSWVGRS